MAIKKYFATKNNTITNAFESNLVTRGTGANMGLSDVLEVFSIYGQAIQPSSSAHGRGSEKTSELSRVLVHFPINEISTDRSNEDIPASGSVDFYLRLYNAKHGQTTPRSLNLEVAPVAVSWEEGFGMDMEEYQDITRDVEGSNWMNATNNVANATLVDAIDISGHANGDKFTMTVPASAGGDAVTYTFLFDSTTNVNNDTGANTFGISRQIVVDDGALRDALIDAINGTANSAVKYGDADTGAGSTLAAGTIGLTAKAGSGAYTVTLTMDRIGGTGNVANVLSAVTNFAEGDKLITTAFTGGGGPWNIPGGDYLTSSVVTTTLDKGTEDLEINITEMVEEWISSDGYTNYGLGVKLTDSQEAYFDQTAGHLTPDSAGATTGSVLHNPSGAKRSYYTKKFFGRGTEFFFKKPAIEARWDSATKDQRGEFFYSSSLASEQENINTIYFYNYFRGQLRNIPGIDSKGSPVYVEIYSGSTQPGESPLDLILPGGASSTVVTGGYESVGIYTASFALTASEPQLTTLFDVWLSGTVSDAAGGGTTLHTGSIKPKTIGASNYNPSPEYTTTITNLKSKYYTNENPTFRLYIREKNWCPTVYTRATDTAVGETIEDGYYKILRVADNAEILPFGTGSAVSPQAAGSAGSYTRMSYDVSGSYFDYDMSLLEPGYMYGLKFAYFINGSYVEQPQTFKFRVEELEDQ